MKQYCRYVLIDLRTGYLLAGGEKYKDFENGKIRYIQASEFRLPLFFWRKIVEYFRNIEINGVPCVIVYRAVRKRENLFNFVSQIGRTIGLRGKKYLFCSFDEVDYNSLIKTLGVSYENA